MDSRILKHPASERQPMSAEAEELFKLGLEMAKPETETCGNCLGYGWYGEWGRPKTCPTCNGTGRVTTNPTHTESDFSVQAELSIGLERIAQELFRCWWILTGKQTTADWRELSTDLQDRYRRLAERAIATINPENVLKLQAQAAKDTDDYVNAFPGRGKDDAMTYADIALEAVSRYEVLLTNARVGLKDGDL
jgi:hypothetical protein